MMWTKPVKPVPPSGKRDYVPLAQNTFTTVEELIGYISSHILLLPEGARLSCIEIEDCFIELATETPPTKEQVDEYNRKLAQYNEDMVQWEAEHEERTALANQGQKRFLERKKARIESESKAAIAELEAKISRIS